jgi:hypothetical protein
MLAKPTHVATKNSWWRWMTSEYVKVRLDDSGKVHYAARDTPAAQAAHRASYMQIPINNFAIWKGAGKRSRSDKVTDPKTGKSYLYKDNGALNPSSQHSAMLN